jgi:seryl-tRNA synthetase
MKFDLSCTLTLNKSVAETKQTLHEYFEDINTQSQKNFTISKWSIKDNAVSLNLTSTGAIRAHEQLLRIKKSLDTFLGKKYRLGIRKLHLDTYTIEFDLEEKIHEKITIPFADVHIENSHVILLIKDKNEEFLTQNYVDRMIKLVREKADFQKYEGKKELWKPIWQSTQKSPTWAKDPTTIMTKLGWIQQGPTKGKWFFQPPATAIMRTMEKIALETVLTPLGFHEVIPSMHVPFSTWLKTGHLEGMPGEMYYISEPVTRDIRKWETFIDMVKITKEIPSTEFQKMISIPSAGLCYAQCPNIYWSFSGKTIAESSLPLLLYDKSVPSARYESGGRHGIERVDEFHRIEVVYIGTKEQLIKLKEQLIDRYTFVFDKILDLEWRMAQVTPFYLQQAGKLTEEEDFSGTIDFEAWLPYRGNRDKEWLEFQNVSLVGEKYVKAFNIKTQKNILWSGCSGIGLERWTTAFLSQKGIDPKNWPPSFKKYLPVLPSAPEFM